MILIVVLGGAAGLVADDGYYKITKGTEIRSVASTLSFVGGLISIVRAVQSKCGSILMTVLHRRMRYRRVIHNSRCRAQSLEIVVADYV